MTDPIDEPREPELNLDVLAGDDDRSAEPELNLDALADNDTPESGELNLDALAGDDDTPEASLNFATGDDFDTDHVSISLADEEETHTSRVGGDEEEIPEVAAAMAELREHLRFAEGDWYVVHTYSGMENRVKQNIDNRAKSLDREDCIFQTEVPTEQVEEIRGNQKKTVTRTIHPGYVLVRMDMEHPQAWSTVRQTPSVTGFVSHDPHNPIPLSLDEVERMLAPSVKAKAMAQVVGKPKKKKVEVVDHHVGDNVMISDGPFTGLHATIAELQPNSKRLKAVIEMAGGETTVELGLDQIQRI